MDSEPSRAALHQIRTLFGLGAAGGLTDTQLLERFAARRDASSEAAFAALVERHGPMVLGVCRRILAEPHDAEDAFQATFLVLVRKAGSIARRDRLAGWLHGVACRTAKEARVRAARRRAKEAQRATAAAHVLDRDEEGRRELRELLDEELGGLPETYRLPLVLCELEGRPRAEAAGLLGIPEGTLSSRLARAREKLRERLARRGLALSAGVLATGLSREATAAATLPPALAETTTRGVLRYAGLGLAPAGLLSASVITLAEGVLKAMLLTKVKLIVASLVTFGALALGAGLLAQPGPLPAKGGGPGGPNGPQAEPPKGKGGVVAAESDNALILANRALAREQLDLVKQALSDLDQLAKGGEKSLSDAAFSVWGRRRFEALRAAGAGRDEIVAELQRYLDFMKAQERFAKQLLEKDMATRLDVWDAQYRRIEAEMWLNQEKAR